MLFSIGKSTLYVTELSVGFETNFKYQRIKETWKVPPTDW